MLLCEEPPPLVHVCAPTLSRGVGKPKERPLNQIGIFKGQQWTMVLSLQLATAPAGTPPRYTTTILHSLLQMRDFYLLLPVACCRRWFLGNGIRRATLQPKLSDLAAALCPPLLRKAQADHCLSILNIILLFLLLSTRSHAGISKPIQSGRTANNQLFGNAPSKELKKSTRKGKGNQW